MKLSSSLRVILGLVSLSLVCQAEDDFDKGKITIGLCENRKFMREKRRMIAMFILIHIHCISCFILV